MGRVGVGLSYAVLALIAITAIIVIWNKWFSRTRVAFINYQATTLGEISKANNNPFVVIEELPLENLDDIDDYDMVFMNAMGIRLTEEQRDKIQMAGWTGTNILTTMSVNPDNYIVSVDSITADTLNAYLRGSSRKNYRSMLNYVRQNVDGKIIFKGEVEKAVPAPEGMFSHPDIDNPDDEDLYFDNIKDYEAYLQKHGLMKADAPKVIVTGMMGNPDDLVTALEKSGNTVYHVNKSLSAFIKANPSLHFNAVVNLAHGRLGDKVVEWLGKQNIPLFSTLSVNRLTSEWEDDKQGMSGGFLSQSIVTPEIDGSIRPYVLFAQRINNEGIHEQYTIPERLAKFVTTVNSYISLQKKNNKDKRVAIVYFKGPGEQSLTASGLAVVPSLYNLLTRMRQEGYNVSGLPENSEKLAELLQRKGSPISDFSLLDAHPDTVVKVQFGNIALLPQPLAGHGDNTFQIVHGTDKDPVKEFQNAYYWIQNTFKADAMIHFGTHGGLEYTPRKQVALSSNDWPEKLVGTIPHFYIYTIGNVGEALIAKRRTYAGIQSHLTAPFLESNLRGTYKALSNAIELYNKAPNNSASLAVKKLAVAMGIHRDLGLDSTLTKPWNETDIAKVEEFGEEIANEKIVGQLYTLGIPYENARIESSVYAMTIDPIAYGMLRLDKQLKRAKADTEKHKALFTTLYMNPARTLVARLIKSNTSVSDAFICQTAGITQAQLDKAREIEASKHNSGDMMSMMMEKRPLPPPSPVGREPIREMKSTTKGNIEDKKNSTLNSKPSTLNSKHPSPSGSLPTGEGGGRGLSPSQSLANGKDGWCFSRGSKENGSSHGPWRQR